MFDKFTERARKVMSLARQESQRLHSDAIKTEHVLLAIVQEGGGVAAKVLKNLNIDLDRVRQEVERLVGQIPTSPTAMLGQLPISPRVKNVIVLAEEAAQEMSQGIMAGIIGTESLLIGLLKESEGVAAQALTNLGLKIDKVQAITLDVLSVIRGGGEEEPKPRVVAEPTNDKWTWQKMGTIEVLSKDPEASVQSTLTIWEMLWDSRFTDFYAVGRTQETAIVIRAADWEMVYAMINTDSAQHAKFRSENRS